MSGAASLPTGTVTFLFTDIENSTKLLQRLGTERFDEVLGAHTQALRSAFADGGHEVRVEGDALFVVFLSAPRAVAAAAAAQRALTNETFPHDAEVRVRMGLHTGEGTTASVRAGADYVGIDVHRAARITAAGHGGQVLISDTTRSLVENALPAGVTLRDLGEHQLKDLARPERLFQLVIERVRADFPAIRDQGDVPSSVPAQLTSFVGREREIEEGSKALADARLLTLTGPGGTGKTRLSIAIAGRVAADFPDGTHWVPLASIFDPELVLPTIGSSLGLADSGSRPVRERVIEHVRGKRALFVIDNFEQVLSAAGNIGEILRAAPGVKAIVSSRAPLRVYGEREFPVPPLGVPERGAAADPDRLSQYESVRLFIDRAVAVTPDFRITNDNAPAVAEICARLDGLPLAIELAAARVKLLPPAAMLSRLERSLAMLSGGARDLPERQQTLRGAIAWSYDLLAPRTRRLFERLAVFVGGASLEEIEAVCGTSDELSIDVLEGVGALVDHSLLRQREVAGDARFQMLVTIREFARERLEASGDLFELARRHAAAYVAVAERNAAELTSAASGQRLDRMEREHDNLRAAMEWAIRNDAATAMRLGFAMWRFWHMRGHLEEGRGVIERVLSVPDDAVPQGLRAKALEAAGGTAYWQGDIDAARRFYDRALELSRASGERHEVANALYNLSFSYTLPDAPLRDVAGARTLLEEALALYRQLGDERGVANVLWAMTDVLYAEGRLDEVARVAEEAATMYRKLGDRFGLGWALFMIGNAALVLDQLGRVRTSLTEAVGIFRAANDVSAFTLLLDGYAALALAEQRPARAVRLAGAAEALRERTGSELGRFTREFVSREIYPTDAHRAAYPEDWAAGRAMDADAAVAYALGGDSG
ncbi:MAG: diguanylate cyclase [Chloroflexota bacterium]|nr:diguanylate cyclase [Chloroflexota bacterium]